MKTPRTGLKKETWVKTASEATATTLQPGNSSRLGADFAFIAKV
jgi:hypothetical protein